MTSPPSQPKTAGGGIEDDQDCDGVASDADPGDGAVERGHELDSAGDAVRAHVPNGRVRTLWGDGREEPPADKGAAGVGDEKGGRGGQAKVQVVEAGQIGMQGAGEGECSWEEVERALAVAAEEQAQADGTLHMPQYQCGVPTTTHTVRGGGDRQYTLSARAWEWVETHLWFAVQRRRAAVALTARLADLATSEAHFVAIAASASAGSDTAIDAEEAVGVLRDAAAAYVDYTADALAATRLRLTSLAGPVTHRPLMHWWSMDWWLRDWCVLGVGSSVRRWPEPAEFDNYKTASEPGTEKEYRRLWKLGFWEDGQVDVRAPLGARLKPNGKYRGVYDATAGGLNQWVHRSRFPLAGLEDFLSDFHPSSYLCKADWADWFYHINAAEYTRRLMGVTDPDSGRKGRYAVWAMGARETPTWGNIFGGEVLRQLMLREPFVGRRVYNPAHGTRSGDAAVADGLRLPSAFRLHRDGGLAADGRVYVDDAGLRGRSWTQAADASVQYARVTRDCGIVMSYPKSEGPSQRLSMLGMGVDVSHPTQGYTVFIPDDKRAAALKMLKQHERYAWKQGFDTRRNLCAMASKLYWMVPACPYAADQCREMWDVAYAGVDAHDPGINFDAKVRITGNWKGATRWWKELLADPSFSGETVRGAGRHNVLYGWSDASGSTARAGAWGATAHMRDDDGVEHQHQAHADFVGKDVPQHSTYKELRGLEEQVKLLDSSDTWRERARGGRMICHTDCMSIAQAVQKRRAHAQALRPLIRRIRKLCARLDLQLEARWCSGERMIAQGCDSASREHRLGVFADDTPDADTFLPTRGLGEQWTEELGDELERWGGVSEVSFDPAAWDDVETLRRGVALAPRADDSRRCIVTALDTVRMHEFELGLTVVVVETEPCNFRGLRKYFPRQRRIQPGECGLSKEAATGIWFLQRAPVEPPAVGGMRREGVEQRMERRWETGQKLRDEHVIDELTRAAGVRLWGGGGCGGVGLGGGGWGGGEGGGDVVAVGNVGAVRHAHAHAGVRRSQVRTTTPPAATSAWSATCRPQAATCSGAATGDAECEACPRAAASCTPRATVPTVRTSAPPSTKGRG